MRLGQMMGTVVFILGMLIATNVDSILGGETTLR